MTIMSGELKIRSEYRLVRSFVGEHKDYIGLDVSYVANQLERILDIQGGAPVSQRCLCIFQGKLITIKRSLTSSGPKFNDTEYQKQREEAVSLIDTMLSEISQLLDQLRSEARQQGNVALLGDPVVAQRILAYLRLH